MLVWWRGSLGGLVPVSLFVAVEAVPAAMGIPLASDKPFTDLPTTVLTAIFLVAGVLVLLLFPLLQRAFNNSLNRYSVRIRRGAQPPSDKVLRREAQWTRSLHGKQEFFSMPVKYWAYLFFLIAVGIAGNDKLG